MQIVKIVLTMLTVILFTGLAGLPLAAWLYLLNKAPDLIQTGEVCYDLGSLEEYIGLSNAFIPLNLSKRRQLTLDFMAAGLYLAHFILPFVPLFFLETPTILIFLLVFGWNNLITAIFQIFFPAAPPWAQPRLPERPDVPLVPAARLINIDKCLGWPLFETIFKQNRVVYGAFPSLHCTWPMLVYYSFVKESHYLANWFVVHTIWVGWSTVWLGHHYWVDVLAGLYLGWYMGSCI